MILKCNWKCKSHGAGNLSPTHPSGQPSLSCPWTSPCIHCSVHNTIIFSLSHLSPVIVTGIFFSLQCLTEKKYYPSLCPFHFSSLSLSYVFLHLNSGFFTIFFFFFCLCASWIIRSWFITYLLQSDWEVFLQFTWILFFTADLLWPSQLVWIQTSNCFLMLMHSPELTLGIIVCPVTFHIWPHWNKFGNN